MLNLGMVFVHFLRDDSDGLRWSFQLGAIDNSLGRSATLGWRRSEMSTGGRRLDGSAGNGNCRGRGDALQGRAVIDDSLVPDGVIVDDGSMRKDAANVILRQAMTPQVAIGEIMQSDEREVLGAQTEVKASTDSPAIESPTSASIEHSMRRQGCPPAFIA